MKQRDEWGTLVASLAEFVRGLAAGAPMLEAPPPPLGLEPGLVDCWNTLTPVLMERASPGHLEKESKDVVDQLCVALAAEPGPQLKDWLRVAGVLSRIGGETAFLDQIAPDVLRDHEQDLLALPAYSNPLDLLAEHGSLNEPELKQSYLEEFSRRERATLDRWGWLKQVERDASRCLLGAPLWQQARLLKRLGGLPWLRFIHALPHTLIRELVLDELQSPDEAMEWVRLELDEAMDDAPLCEEVLVLLVQRTFALWNHIDGCEQELPARARALAEHLLQGDRQKLGFRASAMALRHLFVPTRRWDPQGPEGKTTPIIREAFVQSIAKSGSTLSDIVGAILGARPTKSALLSAALVVMDELGSFSEEERVNQAALIWTTYGEWLKSEPYFLNGPLEEDERQLALALGWVLAKLLKPEATFSAVVASVRHSAEGWKADYQKFINTRSNVLHLLIVGAMASGRRKQRNEPAQALFRRVWDGLHSWLRTPQPSGNEVELQSAIAYTWATLWLVEGPASTELALAALQRLDRLEWILLAASNLRNNMAPFGGADHLPLVLQEVIWSRFKRMFPILRLRRSETPGQAARHEQDATVLTPDVQRA